MYFKRVSHLACPVCCNTIQYTSNNNELWFSEDAYEAWFDGINVPGAGNGHYKTIVYNTVVDRGEGDKGHSDRGDIAIEIIDYCTNALGQNINTENAEYLPFISIGKDSFQSPFIFSDL